MSVNDTLLDSKCYFDFDGCEREGAREAYGIALNLMREHAEASPPTMLMKATKAVGKP